MISFGAKRGVPIGKEGVGEGRGCGRLKSKLLGLPGVWTGLGADWEWSGDWCWRWGVSHHSQRKTQVWKLVVATTVDSSVAAGKISSLKMGLRGWRSSKSMTGVSDPRAVCTEVRFKILNWPKVVQERG